MRPQFSKLVRMSLPQCAALALLMAALAGCGKEEVRVYTVAKEKQPITAAAHGHIHWSTPSGWVEQPASGMRAGSFSITKGDQAADMSIVSLPGNAGSDLENVNRWRGQIGLEPISEDKLSALTEKAAIGSGEGKFYEMVGVDPKTKKSTRVLTAVLEDHGMNWFFKLTGPDELVAGEKPTFLSFLKSVTFHDEDHVETSKPQNSQTDKTPSPAQPESATTPSWDVPPHWKKLPSKPMLLAVFGVSDSETAKAEVTVSSFPGEVGGMLANVNRWRGQLALPSVTESDLTKVVSPVDVNGVKASLVDLVSEKTAAQPATRLVVLVVPKNGQTWFFKITGNDQLVAREKPVLLKFVQSMR